MPPSAECALSHVLIPNILVAITRLASSKSGRYSRETGL
jgi:hypothetical protein